MCTGSIVCRWSTRSAQGQNPSCQLITYTYCHALPRHAWRTPVLAVVACTCAGGCCMLTVWWWCGCVNQGATKTARIPVAAQGQGQEHPVGTLQLTLHFPTLSCLHGVCGDCVAFVGVKTGHSPAADWGPCMPHGAVCFNKPAAKPAANKAKEAGALQARGGVFEG